MAGFVDDCVDVLKFSVSWKSEGWILGMFVLIFIASLISSTPGQYAEEFENANPVLASTLGLLSIAVLIIFMFVFLYLGAKIALSGLNRKGFGNINLDIGSFVSYIVLHIFMGLSVLFPWMDMKLLAAGIFLLVGMAATGIGFFLSIAGMISNLSGSSSGPDLSSLIPMLGTLGFFIIFAMAASILWTFVGIRLFAARYIFLAGKGGAVDSIKKSWELTLGKFWKVFGTNLVFGIVIGILFGAVTFAVAIPGVVVMFIEKGGNPDNPALISTAILLVLGSIIAPIRIFVEEYGRVGIYSLIDTPGQPGQSSSGPSPSPILGQRSKMEGGAERIFDQH